MPSAVRGAASPWFTGAGSDLLVTTCELKVPFKLQLTDHGQTTNTPPPLHKKRKTLASRGLEEPAHALRGLDEFFLQLFCCVSFWFWREIGFGFTYYYLCT
jgi:hypothetical protein